MNKDIKPLAAAVNIDAVVAIPDLPNEFGTLDTAARAGLLVVAPPDGSMARRMRLSLLTDLLDNLGKGLADHAADAVAHISAAERSTWNKKPVQDVTYDGATAVLTVTYTNGTTATINLPKENFLADAAFDYVNNKLTLKLSDGTVFTVDMAELANVYRAGSGLALDTDTGTFSISAGGVTLAMLATDARAAFAAASHTHAIADVAGLQTALSSLVSDLGDLDTELGAHTGNAGIHVSAEDRARWDAGGGGGGGDATHMKWVDSRDTDIKPYGTELEGLGLSTVHMIKHSTNGVPVDTTNAEPFGLYTSSLFLHRRSDPSGGPAVNLAFTDGGNMWIRVARSDNMYLWGAWDRMLRLSDVERPNNSTRAGEGSQAADTTGVSNTSFGTNALASVTTGSFNNCFGDGAGAQITTGEYNNYFGIRAGGEAPGGISNCGFGYRALANAISRGNCVFGNSSASSLTTGMENCVLGWNALMANVSGSYCVAVGTFTLAKCTVSYITAVGWNALNGNTNGLANTAVGAESLYANESGGYNTAVGRSAGKPITAGYNSMLGSYALSGTALCSYTNALGAYTGSYTSSGGSVTNIAQGVFIGYMAGPAAATSTNEIVIGNSAKGGGNNTITLGNSSVTRLYCKVTTITTLSDERVKEYHEPADTAMCYDTVRRLTVSRFKYKDFCGPYEDANVLGFMADDVKQVRPKAVTTRDRVFDKFGPDGKPLMKTITTADGVPLEVPETLEIKGVKEVTFTDSIPTLWGAVQHLAGKVEELEAAIERIKGGAQWA